MKIIEEPSVISAAGDIPKVIEEYVGQVNTGSREISIAKMKSLSKSDLKSSEIWNKCARK